MHIIINADDLGKSREVNNSIFEIMSSKLVTSATMLANGPYLEDALRRLGDFPDCSFGIHLNITEFRPLASKEGLKVLLDKKGYFISNKIRSVKITPSLSSAIYLEFCAQIERLLSLGGKISHIDSHHHIHTISDFFPILKRIQKRYGLRKVRISRNIYPSGFKISKALLCKKNIYNFMLKYYYPTKTTSGCTDFVTYHSRLQEMRRGTIEIMVHPGARGHYEDEIALLRSPWRDRLAFPINAVSYNEL